MRKFLLIFFAPLIVFLAFISALKWFLVPWGAEWALKQLKSYTANNTPVTISADRIDVRFFRPTLDVENVVIQSHKEISDIFDKVKIDKISFQLDLFQIFTGRLQVSAAVIQKPQGTIKVDSLMHSESPTKELPLAEMFKIIEGLPIKRLWIDQTDFQFNWIEKQSSMQLKDAFLSATLDSKKINFKIEMNKNQISWKNKDPLSFAFKTQASISPNSLKILSSELTLGHSTVNMNGLLDSFQKISSEPEGLINPEFNVDLGEVEQFIRTYLPQYKIPKLAGHLKSQGKIKLHGLDNISGDIEIHTNEVKVDQFDIGKADIRGKYKNQKIELEEVNVVHPAGIAKLTKTILNLESPWDFQSQFKVQNLDIQKVFTSIKLNKIPVDLKIQGEGSCQGQIADFHTECQASLLGSDLIVYKEDHRRENAIVDVLKFGAQGTTQIDLEKVTYKAQVFLGENKGQSEGSINYKTGFKINFQSPLVDFKNIKNISGLKIEGETPVEGSTEGNSQSATLKMKLRPNHFIFENYQLGILDGELSYEAGHIKLNQITGSIDQTQYLGHLDVDLNASQIHGELQFPKLDIKDLAFTFDRIYRLPFPVQGLGSGQIKFDGPLDFWHLSYDVTTQFKNGKIALDSFSTLNAKFKSQSGHVKSHEFYLTKNQSRIDIEATLTPEKILDLQARATNFRLEESELVTKFNNQVYGQFNMSARLTGNVFDPNLDISGTLNETIFSDQDVENSFISLNKNENRMQIGTNLFGNKIQSELTIPNSGKKQNLQVRIKTSNWNYGQILALIGGSNLQNEYDTKVTADVDLQSTSGQWTNLSGHANIQALLLKRGSLFLQNTSPMLTEWRDGQMTLKNWNMEGPHNKLQIRGGPFNFQNLDISIIANIEQKLFQLFLPFLDDLGGAVQTQATITGPWDRPQILGDAKLENNFFKIKGFPHPLEKIRADITFSHSKVLIPNLQGVLAGGTLYGNGDIQINGIQDFPTNLKITAEGINLTVPEKIRSSGNADLILTGKWFPFTLSGIYKIQSALFEKEFTESSSGPLTMQTSQYLPKILKEEMIEPLILDIQMNLEKNILVKNSQMEGFVTGQLQVKGPPKNPILIGKVEAEKNTKVTFKDKIFDVQTGQVTFNNPNEMNPEIFLSARSRINEYDVSLIVQGQAKNIIPKLSSSPPLSENDIISLLALGITSTKLEQNVQSSEQEKQAATEVLGTVVNQTVGRGFQNTTGFNFQLSNSYDTTKNISVPKVTISRQLGRKTSLQVSRQLSNSNTTSDVKIQYQLDQNLSAVGSFEARGAQDDTLDKTSDKDQQSIFGLDLEFRREFK